MVATFSIQPMEENAKFIKEESYDISIQVGSSDKTLSLVKAILPELGKIEKIVHNRSKDKVFYETIVYGNCKVIIKSGFSSGFIGSGTRDFQKFLKLLDVSETESERFLFDGTYQKATITIDL